MIITNNELVPETIKQAVAYAKLRKFAAESDEIEGITDATQHEERLVTLLNLPLLTPGHIAAFNTAGVLRDLPGMNVKVGAHLPPASGPDILKVLHDLITRINSGKDPYLMHRSFESLHPYTDGNGRTGRAIWLWQIVNQHSYNMERGFLHEWYYQSLSGGAA